MDMKIHLKRKEERNQTGSLTTRHGITTLQEPPLVTQCFLLMSVVISGKVNLPDSFARNRTAQ